MKEIDDFIKIKPGLQLYQKTEKEDEVEDRAEKKETGKAGATFRAIMFIMNIALLVLLNYSIR